MHDDRHKRSRPAPEPEQDQVMAWTKQDRWEEGTPLVLSRTLAIPPDFK
jgi:hypothetical protein